MTESTMIHLMGVTSLLAGLLMIVFRRSWSVAFCRLGRASVRELLNNPWVRQQVDDVYDERRAPRRFLLLGSAFVAQSPIFFIVGYLW